MWQPAPEPPERHRPERPGLTVDVTGDYAASDPDTLDSDSVNGRVVFLQVAQLRHR